MENSFKENDPNKGGLFMLPALLFQVGKKVLNGGEVNFQEAVALSRLEGSDIPFLLALAGKVREKFSGDSVNFCSIINARSGRCSEDCAFCAQSARHRAEINVYPLVSTAEMVQAAKQAAQAGAHRFSIVTSGRGTGEKKEFAAILEAVARIRRETGLECCCSLGILTPAEAEALKEAGVSRYHHNLETSRSFFSRICATHTFDERVKTIRITREAGLKCCSGGIIGMGESFAQRIEMAFTLKELGVDSIPVNILNPIKGTRLADQKPLPPLEILKTIAIFRLILPDKELRYAGGREVNLRDLQALGLVGGINGMLVGGYLTTAGRGPGLDRQMVADLERTLG